jgi:plastocyanin
MRRLLLLPIAALAAVMVAVAAGATTQTIQVTKSGFTPQAATVNVGDTVTWHNADTADHQVVADDGSFASPVLHSDQSFSHTFGAAGKFKYHDALARTHDGTVTVNGPPAAVTLSSNAGHYVFVQRRLSFGWTTVKRVFLGSNSRAAFTLRLPHGRTSLRLFLPASQAGAGYVAGLSRTIAVRH